MFKNYYVIKGMRPKSIHNFSNLNINDKGKNINNSSCSSRDQYILSSRGISNSPIAITNNFNKYININRTEDQNNITFSNSINNRNSPNKDSSLKFFKMVPPNNNYLYKEGQHKKYWQLGNDKVMHNQDKFINKNENFKGPNKTLDLREK